MTEDDKLKILALSNCRFLPGSYQKKFVKGMEALLRDHPEEELSDKQWYYLQTLYHSYGNSARRQIRGHERHCTICKALDKNQPIIELVCPGCGNKIPLILKPKLKNPSDDHACRGCGVHNMSKFILQRIT